METRKLKPIANSTTFIRVLRDVRIDIENETISYIKMGISKKIAGEKYYRLIHLCMAKCDGNSRYAMIFKHTEMGKRIIVIDRAFYDEF
jgi:hypothetical protein